VQHRYTGDVGDYVKLALLRAVMPGCKLGVAWWLYPDESHNGNGRHVGYLDDPKQWRSLDPGLYDKLAEIIRRQERLITHLYDPELLPDATFFDEAIPCPTSIADRRTSRCAWFGRLQDALALCDLIFLDPDNGLEPAGFRPTTRVAGKSVSFAELQQLNQPGRALIVYHHQTRRKGGHREEIEYWQQRLASNGFESVDAIRARRFSPRVFFLLNAPVAVQERARHFAEQWDQFFTWHGRPEALCST